MAYSAAPNADELSIAGRLETQRRTIRTHDAVRRFHPSVNDKKIEQANCEFRACGPVDGKVRLQPQLLAGENIKTLTLQPTVGHSVEGSQDETRENPAIDPLQNGLTVDIRCRPALGGVPAHGLYAFEFGKHRT